MFTKIIEFKEVLLFYILLALILCLVSYHNKQIDMHLSNNINVVVQH